MKARPASLTLILAGLFASGGVGCRSVPHQEVINLITEQPNVQGGIAGWRMPQGIWQNVGGVSLDANNRKAFSVTAGHGVIVNNPTGASVDLLSVVEHGDAEIHVEFNVPEGSNSGVYLQGRYEVQIFDSWNVLQPKYSDCGGIYERWADNHGYEGHRPMVNASRQPGEWQSFDIIFQAPQFDAKGHKIANARIVRVLHNGVMVQQGVEVTGPTRSAHFEDERAQGPRMLQGDHGPVAFRNIRIKPISL